MKNNKEHLDIDLEFLDKKEAPKAAPAHNTTSSSGHSSSAPTATPVSSGYKYNWKNILIIGGIILFFGWAMFSGSDSSSPSTSNTNTYTNTSNSNDGILTGGQYRCSQYNHDRAGQLEPSVAEGNALDTKTDQLSSESTRLDNEKYTLENEYVDESSQWDIDQHNAKIDDYNSRLQSYKYRAQSHQNDIDAYNARVQTYNNYLTANCTKAY
jgi:hypothetical protein